MSLPAPNLDDRRFQDLVDDAKRLVQQRTRRWTDHNVSDPGVTLIEAFAWITDQMLDRLPHPPGTVEQDGRGAAHSAVEKDESRVPPELLELADDLHDLKNFYDHQKPAWEKLRKACERFQLNRLELVGESLRDTPGIAATVFGILEDVKIRMISQGASEINLTFVIEEDDATEVVRRLHKEFFAQADPEVFA